jgi:hypothetical protein
VIVCASVSNYILRGTMEEAQPSWFPFAARVCTPNHILQVAT